MQEFKKDFIIYHLESLVKDCKYSVYNVLDIDEILMTAFPNVMKNVKTFFVNFFHINQKMDLKRFCKYLLRHFIYYNYHYMCIVQDNRKMFSKKFLKKNPLLKETEGVLLFIC